MSAKGTKQRKPDDEQESKRFVETAQKLEADESGRQFIKAMKAIVPNKRGVKRPGPE